MKNIDAIFKIGILCLGLFFLIIANKFVKQNKYYFTEEGLAFDRIDGTMYSYVGEVGWIKSIDEYKKKKKELEAIRDSTLNKTYKMPMLP